jgi:serine/threonine protein kinase
MSVSLTGFSKNIDAQTQVREGLGQLRSASQEKAQGLLTQLRHDLENKTGVVRLLHTTSTNNDKDMKFKNAGAFKSMFLNGDKLQQSGEVIRDLLKNAGLSDAKVNEFNTYVQARGRQGVKAQTVLKFIDTMRSETGSTPAKALSKFGVDLGAPSRLLGKGAYGTIHTVRYRGEEFVYKQPLKEVPNLGKLQLADESGQPIVPPEQDMDDGEKSYQDYMGDDSYKQPSPLQKINIQHVENEYGNPEFDRSNAIPYKDSSESSLAYNSNDFLQMFLKQQLGGFGGGNNSIIFEPEPESPALESSKPKPLIEEEPVPQPMIRPIIEEASIAQALPPSQLPSESEGLARPDPLANSAQASVPTGPKLARSGLGNVARVKDLPQVITPSVVVVQEQKNDGTVVYHSVAGQKTLKNWARTQASTSEFNVVGLLMPKAAGKTLCDDDYRMTVSRSDLKPLANSALNLLKGLASHGFTHGDIKPANLIWDTKSKTLQLIDNDNLDKVSKKDGSQVNANRNLPQTTMYMNPVGHHSAYKSGLNEQLGLGRDLFAMGLTLLEASLHATGRTEKSETLLSGITFHTQPEQKAIYLKASGQYNKGIKALMAEDFAPGSVEAFARSCIVKSVEYEKNRLGLDENDKAVLPRTATFERYDPKRAGNDQHLLAQLERELALLN